jgi:hypothetical protein
MRLDRFMAETRPEFEADDAQITAVPILRRPSINSKISAGPTSNFSAIYRTAQV